MVKEIKTFPSEGTQWMTIENKNLINYAAKTLLPLNIHQRKVSLREEQINLKIQWLSKSYFLYKQVLLDIKKYEKFMLFLLKKSQYSTSTRD